MIRKASIPGDAVPFQIADEAAFHASIASGNRTHVQALLKTGVPVNRMRNGLTPLMTALNAGHPDVAKLLFLHGGFVAETPEGAQLLAVLVKFTSDDVEQAMKAMEKAPDREMLRNRFMDYVDALALLGTLLQEIRKSPLLQPHFSLHHPVFAAAGRCFPDVVRCGGKLQFSSRKQAVIDNLGSLIQAGDKAGMSLFDKKEAFRYLLAMHCHPVAGFMLHNMPAFKSTLQSASGGRRNFDLLDPLIRSELGSEIIGDNWASQLLAGAAYWSDARTLRLCLAAKLGDVNCRYVGPVGMDIPDDPIGTPLIYATISGNIAALELLLECGARIDLPDRNGKTALMHGVVAGKPDSVSALLASGAECGLTDAEGKTAFDRIAPRSASEDESGMKEMTRIFLRHRQGPVLKTLFQSKRCEEIKRIGSDYFEMADRRGELTTTLAKCAPPRETAHVIAAILCAYPAHVGVEPAMLERRRSVLCEVLHACAAGMEDRQALIRNVVNDCFRLQAGSGGNANGGAYPIVRRVGDRLHVDGDKVDRVPGLEDILAAIGVTITRKKNWS